MRKFRKHETVNHLKLLERIWDDKSPELNNVVGTS